MRTTPHTPQTSPARPSNTTLHAATAGWVAAVCGWLLLAALTLPAGALADSMSLSIAPEPVEELTSQVTYSAFSEEGTLAVLKANNPGVPCAADPAADDGQTLTPGHLLEGGRVGQFSGSVNYTPPSTGDYTLCGWLEIPAGLLETDGGPITSAASLPLDVRTPRISLSLSFPGRPKPGQRLTLNLTATTEVEREVVVEGLPFTKRGCPINYAAAGAEHLIDQDITGGPWLVSTNIDPLTDGTYIFCAWADPPADNGLYPEATTSLALHLGKPQPTPRRHKKPHGARARTR